MEEVKEQKIKVYFTPAIVTLDFGKEPDQTFIGSEVCKPEHKVDGKVPMLYDIHLDKRNCDCGRVRYVSEECGCSIKEYRLIKIPNE